MKFRIKRNRAAARGGDLSDRRQGEDKFEKATKEKKNEREREIGRQG